MQASVFGDGAGKWFQIQGLIAQNFSSLACDYDTAFDPRFQWMPGPWYFYHVVDGVCFYGYQYPYAFLAAPFVKFFPEYGYYLLNFLFLAAFVFFAKRIARFVFPERPEPAELLMGLLAFLVIPSPAFAFDLSEVTLALAMVTGGLLLTLRGAGFSTKAIDPRPTLLFAGGYVTALIFALRTETAMYLATTTIALAFIASRDSIGASRETLRSEFVTMIRAAFKTTAPYVAGALVALACVIVFHLLAFGNLAGNRGSTHAALVFFDFDVSRQLNIARILLFGGPLGLFSSLPSLILAALWLVFPGARQAAGRAGAFCMLACLPYICLVLITAPNDAGYSWSPRYLAFVFVPLYLCILTMLLRWPVLRRWYVTVGLGLLFAHAAHFTHAGMKILQRTSKQNLQYSQAIEKLSSDVLVIDAAPAIGFLSENLLNQKRIYMTLAKDNAQALMNQLAATGVREFIYIRTPLREPTLELTMPVNSTAGGAFRSSGTPDAVVDGMQLYVMRLQPGGIQNQSDESGGAP